MEPLRIYIGYDPRQAVSYTVLQHSILRHTSVPVAIIPLIIETLPVPPEMCGLTPFTFTRYLTPWLAGFKGRALFMDSDVIVRGDIKELFDAATGDHAIWCVHHRRRFEWPSVILWDASHKGNAILTPEYVVAHHKQLPELRWWVDADVKMPSEWTEIGKLPAEWNHLVLYDKPRIGAKLIHFTAGIPAWPETEGCEHTETWREEAKVAMAAVSWTDLMGKSVHVGVVRDHLIVTGKLKSTGRDDGSVAP